MREEILRGSPFVYDEEDVFSKYISMCWDVEKEVEKTKREVKTPLKTFVEYLEKVDSSEYCSTIGVDELCKQYMNRMFLRGERSTNFMFLRNLEDIRIDIEAGIADKEKVT